MLFVLLIIKASHMRGSHISLVHLHPFHEKIATLTAPMKAFI